MLTDTPHHHTGARRPGRRRLLPLLRAQPIGYLLPAVVILAAFALWPLFVLVQMSLSEVGPAEIVGNWSFVGLRNFVDVLGDFETWKAILRTIGLCAILVISNLVLGFIAATVLSTTGRTASAVLGILVFVWALPPLVSGSVWRFLLDDTGTLNAILGLLGISPVNWLSDPALALWSVSAVVAWASLPFSILIMRGGLLAVNPELIEAAAIDGAGFWTTRWRIILPLMRPTLWILAVITVLYAFRSFDFFYVMTQGGPGTSTNTLPVLSYYTAFTNFDMSTGATIAVVSMVVVLAFAVPYVRTIKNEETS
ncbi:carbohydrate ABC transporter permease [Brachybacterium endophyticum]|uniref:carbohydrate ABC transporter permease n=1 Tax=Brachybacterium endophyticum TaxID=2182385 RepID=UPI0010576704|nr:sugar ABC transporter permease [Brachybacterium endophyticum]